MPIARPLLKYGGLKKEKSAKQRGRERGEELTFILLMHSWNRAADLLRPAR